MLFDQCKSAFKQHRTWQRAKHLAQAILSNNGRGTISSWLISGGQQFRDWSASYRLFHGQRVDVNSIFSVLRKETIAMSDSEEENVYAHMDDTLLRKTGKKISGAKWLRDPLGPPFQTNLIWGQRFLQISLSQYEKMGAVPCKTIPIEMAHCPAPVKPGKNGTPEQWEEFKECQKRMKLSTVGADKIKKLRDNLNQDGFDNKTLVLSVDGSYTNQTVLKSLPKNVTLIGRIRKDCKLNALPTQAAATGRKRIYGEELPTPEELRQSDDIEWQEVEAFASGKVHKFNVKVINNVRWRKSGEKNLKLVIIRPVSYRLKKGGRLLYRDPAYLICTDPELPIEKLLQAYIWRWGIEVNFREEKTTLGCGQAQVREEIACEKVPAFNASVYGMLLLAGIKAKTIQLPRPKWYSSSTKNVTTGDLISCYKAINWADRMSVSFDDFVKLEGLKRSRKNSTNPCLSAAIYARK